MPSRQLRDQWFSTVSGYSPDQTCSKTSKAANSTATSNILERPNAQLVRTGSSKKAKKRRRAMEQRHCVGIRGSTEKQINSGSSLLNAHRPQVILYQNRTTYVPPNPPLHKQNKVQKDRKEAKIPKIQAHCRPKSKRSSLNVVLCAYVDIPSAHPSRAVVALLRRQRS